MTISEPSPNRPFLIISIVGLILFVGFSRYIPFEHSNLFNFSPVLAIFLFCGAYLRGVWSWAVPITAIFLSDMILNPNYGLNFVEPFMFITLGSYLVIWILGKKLGNQKNFSMWTCGSVLSALFFYISTSGFAWIANPVYPKSVDGLIQALTIGEPGFAPAYLFLRNSILSTVIFSILFRYTYLWLAHQSTRENKKGFVVQV